MSNINTNGINSSYPVPGVNNSTQGFRDNFTSIKTNLTTAGAEISDLQNKVVVKSALSGATLNNDMANTLISNAAIRSFRATTYNMGNSIPATLTVDVSQGDVQYGTITQNTAIAFGGWSPSGTQSNVQLMLTIANANAYLSFPDTYYNASNVIVSGMKSSARLLENFSSNATPSANAVCTNKVSMPLDVKEIQYRFHSTDCGATIDVDPVNRGVTPSTIAVRTPPANGNVGDVKGTVCTDGTKLYVCTDSYGVLANIATTGASGNGTYATLTFATQTLAPYKVGSSITVSGVTPTGYNGTKTVTACTNTSVTFSSTTTGSQTIAGTISGAKVIWGSVALTAVP